MKRQEGEGNKEGGLGEGRKIIIHSTVTDAYACQALSELALGGVAVSATANLLLIYTVCCLKNTHRIQISVHR